MENRDLKKSEAVILMLDKINFKKTSFFIKIFPTFIRNLVYDFIARYRYNIFGKIK
jgi:predicted DCC family thiol-disulfide oxidoreductase YuxK